MSKHTEESFNEFKQHPGQGMTNYMVAKDGRIFSKYLKTIMRTRRQPQNKPYNCVMLKVKGLSKTKKIAVLVLETYVRSRPSGYQAAHLNGDRFDDRLENLAWVTPQENAAHKRLHGTAMLGERSNLSKLTGPDILIIRKLYKATSRNRSNVSELARRFKVGPSTILKAVKGITWAHI